MAFTKLPAVKVPGPTGPNGSEVTVRAHRVAVALGDVLGLTAAGFATAANPVKLAG
jgi:hypothetical protein